MKKRNLFAVFGLSIITLGIYDLVWLVKVKKELNAKNARVQVPTIWLLFIPLILFIASLIAFFVVVFSNASNNTTTTSNNSGYYYSYNSTSTTVTTTSSNTSSAAGIFVLLYIVGFLLWITFSFYWFFKFSKAVNEYTGGRMNTAVAFLLLWFLHVFGVMFIQDAFNDMIDSGAVPGQAFGPQPAYAGAQPAPAAPSQPMTDVAPAAPVVAPQQPKVVTPTQPAAPAPSEDNNNPTQSPS